ncbi:MAG: hypothetical protein JW982_00215 [Spirochaetes bacterium]|nr:hypothetical protein [Spirochaetota bacterium]
MNLKFSGEILVLSENESAELVFSSAGGQCIYPVFKSNENIYRLSNVKKAAQSNGNFIFLRQNLNSYISERGVPSLVIIDFENDFSSITDDSHVIMKTVFLTFIILSMTRQYENILLNLIIFYKPDKENIISGLNDKKENILSALKVSNEKIASRIKALQSNKTEFNSLFNIFFENSSSDIHQIKKDLLLFSKMTEGKVRLLVNSLKNRSGEVSNKSGLPAEVYMRIGNKYFMNGEQSDYISYFGKISEDGIYISGLWNSSTNKDVVVKIKKTAILLVKSDNFTGSINFHLNDDCRLDGLIASSITQFTVNEFKNIDCRFFVSDSNYAVLSNSNAFSLIRKIVFRKS